MLEKQEYVHPVLKEMSSHYDFLIRSCDKNLFIFYIYIFLILLRFL